jgi:DNA polymerase III epsilon subunit-like protein
MKRLFFDTETTGFPPVGRIIQLAAILLEDDKELCTMNVLIKPSVSYSYAVGEQAYAVHGISRDKCEADGVSASSAFTMFKFLWSQVERVYGHNVSFDLRMLNCSIAGFDAWPNRIEVCTMKSSTDFCQLPHPSGRSGFKWPKLNELYKKLFDEELLDAHDALADIRATVRCYFKLRQLHLFSDV